MYSDLDRIAQGWHPVALTYYRPMSRPARSARPKRGDWHRLDPVPFDTRGPSAGGWVMVALVLALTVASTVLQARP